MEVQLMEIDVSEYVKKEIKYPSHMPLLGIFEAISNSIYSNSKIIKLKIEYEKENKILMSTSKSKISKIKIIDDGEGFNTKNYDAFNLAYVNNKELGKENMYQQTGQKK